MQKSRTSFLITFLIILALVTTGISPACEFISGKTNLIEICTPYGLEKIRVVDNSFSPVQEQGDQRNKHSSLTSQCLFCLSAQTNHAAFVGTLFTPKPILKITTVRKYLKEHIRTEQSINLYQARAPPLLS